MAFCFPHIKIGFCKSRRKRRRYDEKNHEIIIDKTQISKDDKSSGIRSCGEGLAKQLIKNTYKTLLTRGQKGCYIYCEDKPLANYIKMMLKKGKI